MKKQILTIGMAAILAVTAASCKKTYECHCDKVGGGDEHFDIKAKNKGQAESECTKKASGSSTYSKCKLE